MKKIFFLFSLILFSQVSAWADEKVTFYSDESFINCTSQKDENETTSAYFYEEIEAGSKEVSITNNNLPNVSGNIVIPEKVTFGGNEYTITKLGSCAFQNCTEITSVIVPNTVTEFEDDVFYGCEKMTSVKLSESLVTIGTQDFRGCKLLTELIIPDSVVTIGGNCFDECESLKVIVFGSGVTSIGNFEFSGCDSLELIVMKGVTSPTIEGGGWGSTGDQHLAGSFAGVPESCYIIYPSGGDYTTEGLSKGWDYIVNNRTNSMTIEDYLETSTGISEVAKSEAVIGVQRGAVLVTTSENSNVAIYSLSGAMVANKNVNGSEKFDLAQGIYIVKAGNVTRKVSVK